MQDSTHSHPRDALPRETIHAILSSRRRRFLVDVLAGRQAPIDLVVLARAVAMRLPDRLSDGDGEESVTPDLDSIATSFHHVDLPRLADADVVDYDPEEGTVTPRRTDALVPYLDSAESLR